MSSPKRVARSAMRRATNAAGRGGTIELPTKRPVKAVNGASAEAKRLAASIERGIAAGRLDVVSADALQALMSRRLPQLRCAAASGRRFRAGCEKYGFRD